MTAIADRPGVPKGAAFEPAGITAMERAFLAEHPDFDPDGAFAELRRTEYARLDDADQVYLDYTGGGLHAASQIDAHAELLRSTVLGNPHSNNPTSLATTELVERATAARARLLRRRRSVPLRVHRQRQRGAATRRRVVSVRVRAARSP